MTANDRPLSQTGSPDRNQDSLFDQDALLDISGESPELLLGPRKYCSQHKLTMYPKPSTNNKLVAPKQKPPYLFQQHLKG